MDKDKKAEKEEVSGIRRLFSFLHERLFSVRTADFTVESSRKQRMSDRKELMKLKNNVVGKNRARSLTTAHSDFGLLVAFIMLVMIGTVMVISAGSSMAIWETSDSYFFVKKQLLSVGMFAVAFVSFYILGYKFFYRWSSVIFWAGIMLCAAVFLPGIGASRNGATRWIVLPVIGDIQPSELMKFAVLNYFAANLAKDSKVIADKSVSELKRLKALLLYAVCLLIPLGILLAQPHASAAIIIALTAALMLFMAGINMWYAAFGTLGGVLLGIPILFADSYRVDRFRALLDPIKYSSSGGHQILQAMYALGSGGLLGKGIGNSVQKYSYLPEPYNDFIIAIIGEEMGFIGVALVIGLFIYILIRGYTISGYSKNSYSMFLAFGITSLIAIQFVLNIFVVAAIIPNTGITLPFVSYGATSMAVMGGMAGLLLNISKDALYAKQREENVTSF